MWLRKLLLTWQLAPGRVLDTEPTSQGRPPLPGSAYTAPSAPPPVLSSAVLGPSSFTRQGPFSAAALLTPARHTRTQPQARPLLAEAQLAAVACSPAKGALLLKLLCSCARKPVFSGYLKVVPILPMSSCSRVERPEGVPASVAHASPTALPSGPLTFQSWCRQPRSLGPGVPKCCNG